MKIILETKRGKSLTLTRETDEIKLTAESNVATVVLRIDPMEFREWLEAAVGYTAVLLVQGDLPDNGNEEDVPVVPHVPPALYGLKEHD